MKANAPEKIYFNPLLTEDGESIVRRYTFERQRDSQIEYARTDAFIEKAAEWIKNKAERYIVDSPLCSYFDYKRAVEYFRKYIKGE